MILNLGDYMKKFSIKILCVVLALVLALTFIGCSNPLEEDRVPPSSDVGKDNVIPPSNISSVVVNYAEEKYLPNAKEAELMTAIDEVFQSVVCITTTSTGVSGNEQLSAGSGVIVDITADGDEGQNVCYVFTCYHVVENFNEIDVALPKVPVVGTGNNAYYDYANVDFTTYTFTTKGANPTVSFVGGDKSTDVAVLKLNLDGYAGLTVTKAHPVNVSNRPYSIGQTVFAIGNPAGIYPFTASSGIISYINRETNVSGVGAMTLLQVDTPLNHGNSGGGLFNLYGELIGIVNSGNDNYQNIGFAIPATTISATNGITETEDNGFIYIASQLITTAWSDDNGNFNYGYVPGRWKWGVNIGINNDGYPVVVSLEPDSIFLNQLSVNDVIIGFSYPAEQGTRYNVNLNDAGEEGPYAYFSNCYAAMKKTVSIGDKIGITVLRNSATHTVMATLKQTIYRDTGKGLGQ